MSSRVAVFVGIALVAAGIYWGISSSVGDRSKDRQSKETAADAIEATQTEDQRINRFFDEVYERNVSQSPIEQSRLGRTTDRLGEWDDFSDSFHQGQIEQKRADFAQLRSDFDFDALSAEVQLSYELFELEVERAIRDAVH